MWFEIHLSRGSFLFNDQRNIETKLFSKSSVSTGWKPVGIFLVSGGISLVEFAHDNQTSFATWFLDRDLNLIAASADGLTATHRGSVLHTFKPIIEHAFRQAFIERSDSNIPDFFLINLETRVNLWNICYPDDSQNELINLGTTDAEYPFMKDLLDLDFQLCLLDGASQDAIALIDPFDGSRVFSRHGVALDDFRAIYQLRSKSGEDFWICVSSHYASILTVFLPQYDKLFVSSEYFARRTKTDFPQFHKEMRRVTVIFGDLLPSYLNNTKTSIASFLRPPPSNHFGHQLWNELSGLQSVVNNVARHSLPYVLIPNAELGTEAFGPTEEIFPELRRKVLRWSSNVDFRRNALLSGLTLVRYSQKRVTAELRARINVRVNTSPELAADRSHLAEIISHDRKLILLGLRVENRTLDDLKTFVSSFVTMCAEVYPGCTIIVDGHNSKSTELGELVYASHGQWGAKRPPIDVERELASLAESVAADKGVHVLDLIGRSVERSLFWGLHCDCFVTIWGAGLAKYRWVANRPGFVLTSAWNRLNRGDLDIYSSDTFMEHPEGMTFIEASDVVDLPDAEQLVRFSSDQQPESYYNFRMLDMTKLGPIRKFLKSL